MPIYFCFCVVFFKYCKILHGQLRCFLEDDCRNQKWETKLVSSVCLQFMIYSWQGHTNDREIKIIAPDTAPARTFKTVVQRVDLLTVPRELADKSSPNSDLPALSAASGSNTFNTIQIWLVYLPWKNAHESQRLQYFTNCWLKITKRINLFWKELIVWANYK